MVVTELQGLYDPDPVTEQYKITASIESTPDGPKIENSFTITYSGCKQEVAINPPSPFEVNYEIFDEENPSLIAQAEGDAVLTLPISYP